MAALNFSILTYSSPKFIETVLTKINTQSAVKNGGWLSNWFTTSKGVRQGCCVSPLLFVLVVELLANKIRNRMT